MKRPVWYALASVALVLVFQFFFRYQYVHLMGARVMRIDRLSGSSCDLPCIPPPPPTPRPTPTPFNSYAYAQRFAELYSLAKQRAIRIAQAQPMAASLVVGNPDNAWSAENSSDDFMLVLVETTPLPHATPYPAPKTEATPQSVLLVCYCDKKGIGFRWEVHTDTSEAFYANDNADVMKKYGLTPSKK